jgi:hypothetical protein
MADENVIELAKALHKVDIPAGSWEGTLPLATREAVQAYYINLAEDVLASDWLKAYTKDIRLKALEDAKLVAEGPYHYGLGWEASVKAIKDLIKSVRDARD